MPPYVVTEGPAQAYRTEALRNSATGLRTSLHQRRAEPVERTRRCGMRYGRHSGESLPRRYAVRAPLWGESATPLWGESATATASTRRTASDRNSRSRGALRQLPPPGAEEWPQRGQLCSQTAVHADQPDQRDWSQLMGHLYCPQRLCFSRRGHLRPQLSGAVTTERVILAHPTH